MKTTTSRTTSASKLFLSLLLALAPLGTACVGEVDDGENEGEDDGALHEDRCDIGETRECWADDMEGFQTCIEVDGEGVWGDCQGSAVSTPLVLAFEGQPVVFEAGMAGSFDLTGLSVSVATDWPTAATPWLALDRNGNGAIDGGEELFGSATVLAGGARADNGFTALAELDANGDGRITEQDDAWSRLVIWSDRDQNRASTAAELAPLAARGVVAIELGFARDRRCDACGNCEIERAAFSFADGAGGTRTGAIVDVHLKWQ